MSRARDVNVALPIERESTPAIRIGASEESGIDEG